MNAEYSRFENRFFAGFFDLRFDFFTNSFRNFFYSAGMYSAVAYEFLKGLTRYFSSYGVKSRQRNYVWGIVYYYVHTRHGFKRFDVSAHSSDYSAFHFFTRKFYYAHGRFCGVVYGTSLNSKSDNVFRFLLAFFFRFGFDFFNHSRRFEFRFVGHLVNKNLFCVFTRNSRNFLNFEYDIRSLLLEFVLSYVKFLLFLLDILLCSVHRFDFVVENKFFLVERIFFLVKSVFRFLNFGSSLFGFLFKFVTQS